MTRPYPGNNILDIYWKYFIDPIYTANHQYNSIYIAIFEVCAIYIAIYLLHILLTILSKQVYLDANLTGTTLELVPIFIAISQVCANIYCNIFLHCNTYQYQYIAIIAIAIYCSQGKTKFNKMKDGPLVNVSLGGRVFRHDRQHQG